MRDRAAYMRAYRLRQRSEWIKSTTMPSEVVADLLAAQDRIRILESEIARLKRELAASPIDDAYTAFRPVPKRR